MNHGEGDSLEATAASLDVAPTMSGGMTAAAVLLEQKRVGQSSGGMPRSPYTGRTRKTGDLASFKEEEEGLDTDVADAHLTAVGARHGVHPRVSAPVAAQGWCSWAFTGLWDNTIGKCCPRRQVRRAKPRRLPAGRRILSGTVAGTGRSRSGSLAPVDATSALLDHDHSGATASGRSRSDTTAGNTGHDEFAFLKASGSDSGGESQKSDDSGEESDVESGGSFDSIDPDNTAPPATRPPLSGREKCRIPLELLLIVLPTALCFFSLEFLKLYSYAADSDSTGEKVGYGAAGVFAGSFGAFSPTILVSQVLVSEFIKFLTPSTPYASRAPEGPGTVLIRGTLGAVTGATTAGYIALMTVNAVDAGCEAVGLPATSQLRFLLNTVSWVPQMALGLVGGAYGAVYGLPGSLRAIHEAPSNPVTKLAAAVLGTGLGIALPLFSYKGIPVALASEGIPDFMKSASLLSFLPQTNELQLATAMAAMMPLYTPLVIGGILAICRDFYKAFKVPAERQSAINRLCGQGVFAMGPGIGQVIISLAAGSPSYEALLAGLASFFINANGNASGLFTLTSPPEPTPPGTRPEPRVATVVLALEAGKCCASGDAARTRSMG